MRRNLAGSIIVLALFSGIGAEASTRFLRHPVFQALPEMELRIELQSGYSDTGNFPLGLLGSFGVGINERLMAGLYTQVYTSDRDLPSRTKRFYGIGGFVEYGWDLSFTLEPYAGLRVGILDPTGPVAPTLPYIGCYTGVKYALNERAALTASLTYHWAGEEDGFKAYDYKRKGSSYRSSSSDLTLDVGVRLAF